MDPHKFKAVVHYICIRCCTDSTKPDTAKLNTILWLADGKTYARLGSAILGEDYTRESEGPKSVHLDSILMQLEQEGHVTHTIGKENEYTASGAPDLSAIRDAELRILDEVIRDAAQTHPFQVNDSAEPYLSLPEQAWEFAVQGERVPYQQELITRFLPLTKDDQEWVKTELARLQ